MLSYGGLEIVRFSDERPSWLLAMLACHACVPVHVSLWASGPVKCKDDDEIQCGTHTDSRGRCV